MISGFQNPDSKREKKGYFTRQKERLGKMTDNLDENKKITLTITDNNKTVNLNFDSIENSIWLHNTDSDSHPYLDNQISIVDEKVTQYGLMVIQNNSELSQKYSQLENQLLINKSGDSSYRFAVAEAQEDFDAVNKAYLIQAINEMIQKAKGSLFDMKVSEHLIDDGNWVIADGNWLYKTNYPDAYEYLLNQFSLGINYIEAVSYIADNAISNKNINYYKSSLGYKMVASESEFTNVDELFAATNSAWYYQLDTNNERFKLPRTMNFFQVQNDSTELGDFVEAGLPNITGEFGIHTTVGVINNKGINDGSLNGAFTQGTLRGGTSAGAGEAGRNIKIDASLSSKIYGMSSSVQPRVNKMLLYFKVK